MDNEQKIYVCGTCGSRGIEVLAWTKMNTKQFSDWLNETDEDCYCPVCECHGREVVDIDDYKTTDNDTQIPENRQGEINPER